MSSTTLTPTAVSSELRRRGGHLWRVVESQRFASTMKLVDSVAEQAVLEDLVEEGKPTRPTGAGPLHYLLATPFRYPPSPHGSRFRSPADPGVFYGAEAVRTGCAEVGYWRWRFLTDSPDLPRIDPVGMTAFRVQVDSRAVDLRKSPFDRDAAIWTHPRDYTGTQAFGRVARAAKAGAIVYRSVRDPKDGTCVALLTPAAFARRQPDGDTQEWSLTVRPDGVSWRRGFGETFEFASAGWQPPDA